MIDITKDEFWDSKEEVSKAEKKVGRLKRFIKNNKIIIGLIIVFLFLMIFNTFLIYSFFKIIINI